MNDYRGLTQRLAHHASNLTIDSVGDRALATARATVSDALACAIAGSHLVPEVVGPLGAVTRSIPNGRATSVVDGASMSPEDAAFINAGTVHTIDFDDTLMAVVAHLGASVVPSAVAAAEHAGASSEVLLTAVVAGFDVAGRVGRSIMPQHYQRWHATASLGGIASATAAAVALGLDSTATEMAIGIAADDTGGTRSCIRQGDITKSLHPATAAHKGVRAALLVEAGARGPSGFLEDRFGFYWAYSEEGDPRRLPEHLDDLGDRWEIEDNDFKAHPCILSSHTAIEGVIDLMTSHDVAAPDIDRVELFQPPYSDNHGLNYEPQTTMSARLSVPYVVAAAILFGHVGLEEFEAGAWLDAPVRDLMRRVTITPDPDLGPRYPGQAPNRTRITTNDGTQFETEIGVAKGSHVRPFTDDEHRSKIDDLLSYRLDDDSRRAWHATIDGLGRGATIGDLTSLFLKTASTEVASRD